MVEKPRLSLESADMCMCCSWRTFGGLAMGAKPRLSLG